VVALALSACGGGGGGGGVTGGGGSGGGGRPPAAGEANRYLPFPLGATWDYQLTTSGQETRTHAQVKGISPMSGGHKVDYHVVTEPVGGVSVPDQDLTYSVFDDGHLGVPLSAASGLFDTKATVSAQDLVFPRPADIEQHTRVSVVVHESLTILGDRQEATVTESAQGTGTRTVTVPAGTFETQVLEMNIDIDLPGLDTVVHSTGTIFLAKGVGIVRQELRGRFNGDQVLTRSSLVR